MEFETDKGEHDAIINALQWVFFYGVALVLMAYGGHLWIDTQTKTAELAECKQMEPNLAIDCPLAAQVAECDAKYPWATCETVR